MVQIKEIKQQVEGKNLSVILKGVMCREDALLAVQNGADGVWISTGANHKPTHAPSAIEVLSSISSAVKKQKPDAKVFIDTNIKRGTDVLKCLAFGADAVFMCRPVMWALETGGTQGIKEMMKMINEELKLSMALTHCSQTSQITQEQVIHMLKPKM